jgi:hypothetical protein
MGFSYKTKAVYFLVTDTAIYRSDAILDQINEWIAAFKTGQLIPVGLAAPESLDEYEAHLAEVLLERQKMKKEEIDIEF